MSLQTCAVRVRLYTQDGAPDVGATVTATLNRFEVDEGYIVPREITVETDADGVAVLNLWPNALGSTESTYKFRIVGSEGRVNLTATVPDTPACDLEDIATLPPYPGKKDGELAAELAAEQAVIATTQAGIATSSASASVEKAGEAASAAALADERAAAATDSAAVAGEAKAEAVAAAEAAEASAAAAAEVEANMGAISTGLADAHAQLDALGAEDGAGKVGYGGRTVADKLGEVVSVKDAPFNAKGDGVTDDTAAIQAALDSGKPVINADGLLLRVTGTLTMSTAGQRLVLGRSTLTLDTATASVRAIDVTGAGAIVEGGTITSTSRKDFLLRLAGVKSKAKGTVLNHATPPGQYPMDEASITYNKGGVEMRGVGASVDGVEAYNFIGIGVISYAADQRIERCNLHHNGFGAHIDHAETGIVTIHDNVFDTNDSLGILANHEGVVLSFRNNTTRGNGSHGAYLRCYNSTVIGNTAYNNYRDGLKIRDCDFTVASNNSCFGNNVEGSSAGAEMRLQINENGATGVTVANNTWRSTNPVLTSSFSVSWVGPSTVCDRLSVVGNNGENMNLAHSDKLLCANNVMSGRIQMATANAAAPNPQPRARVIGNYATELFCTNRVTDSVIQANTFDQITTTTTGGNANNRVLGNTFLAQAVGFERRFFKEFSGNNATITAAVTTAVFKEANNASDNSGKIIRDNTITGNTTSLIADSASTVSGDKNILTGNVSDLSSGSSMFSLWGSNHVVMGNVCTGTSPSSFVGMNNSFLFANWPRGGERAGTTGNQNLYYLTGTTTYDPPSLADGEGVTTTVTVTGANFGDFASAAFQHPANGVVLTAWVSAVDTVSVRFQNESGGAVDLASGTLRARVHK